MEKGSIVIFKGSKVLREIVHIDKDTVNMHTLDENGIRKILTSNDFRHTKSISREYFDKQVQGGKIIDKT